MEELGFQIVYPTLDQIVEVNRRMIGSSGGYFVPPDNLRNRRSLEYVLAAVQFPLLGKLMYPAIEEKAAALAFEIIRSHVFFDGNKRTGIHVAWMLLRSNAIMVSLDDSIVDLAVRVAVGTASRSDLVVWLCNHLDS